MKIALIREYVNLRGKLILAGLQKENFRKIEHAIELHMSSFPIEMEEIVEQGIMYWLFGGDKWFPVHGGEETSGHWLQYMVRYKDGAVESGIAQPYSWAHCTADDNVNYHWFDAE